MIGFYNYTVWLTYFSLLSSVSGIFLAMSGHVRTAAVCLLVSGVCDMFDGKIARTKKDRTDDEKRFGIQIDSLCDIVCFGVFPAVLSAAAGADKWWQLAVAALFVLCGVIRLAYFNVTEETGQSKTDKKRESYAGLPITASALFMPLLLCFAAPLGSALPCACTALLAVMGICYIAPIKVRKPGLPGCVLFICLGLAVLVMLLV